MARKSAIKTLQVTKRKGAGVAALLRQTLEPLEPALAPDEVVGKVLGHRDGFGFLQPDDGQADYYLGDREMQKVMHGDRVLARKAGLDRRGRQEAVILRIIERANRRIVGRLVSERGVLTVIPEDQRIKHDILVPPGATMKAKVGQVVTVELTDSVMGTAPAYGFETTNGKIVEVLGDIDDAGMEIEIAVRKFEVPHVFSAQTLSEASALPSKVSAADLKGRIDLRDVPLVTIDGEDARDFDDAVYCEPAKVGRGKGWRLLVAIADVSHYVRAGTAIELDAQTRSTSVYFPRRVIPMLPEKLSNGLCSLNPAVDRLVMVCDMVVTAGGEVKAYQFYPGVIHSAARLTYNQVWGMLSGGDLASLKAFGAIKPNLDHLYTVFKALLEQRTQRGAMELDTVETKILCDAAGRIDKIVAMARNDAHRLIEECMLAANVCAADFIARSRHPGLYRVHEGPNEEKLERLRAFLKTLGMSLGGADAPTPRDYARLMPSIRGRPDAALIQTMMLRSMQQAVYSPQNAGHFGLAYEAYTHFTSPIRRYPDLLVHRVIKALLQGRRYQPDALDGASAAAALPRLAKGRKPSAPLARSEPVDAEQAQDELVWTKLGANASANERRADEASRDVEAWLKCQYMKGRIGEEFKGHISGVTTFGLFVTLDELYVEGLVHITELGGDYFQYNETTHELRGDRTGKRYRLMDPIDIQVSRVDLEARRLEFRLLKTPTRERAESLSHSFNAPALAAGQRSEVADQLPGAKYVKARQKGSKKQKPLSMTVSSSRSKKKPRSKGKA
jgi:ribonuclease R